MDSSSSSQDDSFVTERKLRYKSLVDRSRSIAMNVLKYDVDEVLDSVKEITLQSDAMLQELNQEENRESGESALDVQIIQTNHRIITDILHRDSDFNAELYIRAILSRLTHENTIGWNKIAKTVCRSANTVRAKPTMLGAINMEPIATVRERRSQRSRTVLAPESKPEELSELKRADKGAEKVNMLHNQLRNIIKNNHNRPVPYYKLVIDPTSMMSSVQNSLQLSFLVRDNIVALVRGVDGHPAVRLTTAEEREKPGKTQQVILPVTEGLCREMTDFYNIKKSMLNINVNSTQ